MIVYCEQNVPKILKYFVTKKKHELNIIMYHIEWVRKRNVKFVLFKWKEHLLEVGFNWVVFWECKWQRERILSWISERLIHRAANLPLFRISKILKKRFCHQPQKSEKNRAFLCWQPCIQYRVNRNIILSEIQFKYLRMWVATIKVGLESLFVEISFICHPILV